MATEQRPQATEQQPAATAQQPADPKPRRANTKTPPAAPDRRRRSRQLHVPVFPEETDAIQSQARAVGMTVAAYLRAVGMGYQPRAMVDRDRIDDMLRVNADLGRLGGLLKLFLTDDAKLNRFDAGQVRKTILVALRRIEENQLEMRSAIKAALREGGAP